MNERESYWRRASINRRTLLRGGAAVAVGYGLSACGGSSSTSANSSARGNGATQTLTLGDNVDLPSLDPAQVPTAFPLLYAQPVYDALLRQTPNGNLVPMLAMSTAYNADRTQLTLTLRSGVKFGDGTDLTPAVVVDNLTRFPKEGGPQASRLAAVDKVVAKGSNQVVLTLSAPSPGLLTALADAPGMIASGQALRGKSLATTPVGSGPYTLVQGQTTAGATYTYTQNPQYWDPSLQKFAGITIKTMTDDTARFNALSSGQIDGAQLSLSDADEAASRGLTVGEEYGNWGGLPFYDRTGKLLKPLADVRVRQAINYALNREQIGSAAYPKRFVPTCQFFSPQSPAYVAALDNAYPYNPSKAKSLLAAAGYGSGFTLEIPVLAGIYNESIFLALQSQLQAVGIKVQLNSTPPPTLVKDVAAGSVACTYAENYQATAWTTVEQYLPKGATYNPLNYVDPHVTALIEKIQSASDADAAPLYRQLNQYIVDQAWYAPFYRTQQLFVARSTIKSQFQVYAPTPYLYDISPA